MNIINNIRIIDLALYVNNVLIIADTHIGYEEALNKQGLLIPRFQFKEIIERLDNIFLEVKKTRKSKSKKLFKKIIINGDIKHEFGTISDQEWHHTLQLLDHLGRYCDEIILIKGNHDTILGPIAKKRNAKIVDHYIISDINEKIPIIYNKLKNNHKKLIIYNENLIKLNNKKIILNKKINKIKNQLKNNKNKKLIDELKNLKEKLKKINEEIVNYKNSIKKDQIKKNNDKKTNFQLKTIENDKKNDILIIHGDKIPEKDVLKNVNIIIIGHEHPAVSIKEGPRSELFKCFLKGKWKNKNLIVQPSFNLVTEGTDVLKEELLSPFLHQNLADFDVFVVADKVYEFGRLDGL